ncbi:MAG: hypothetical protein GY832_40600 [Chloroflexi bacterium]|nr:hypothetical protein [Chloroflexota bacterium]
MRGYLDQVTSDKNEFSPSQKRTLLNILRERGANRQATWNWDRELGAHLRIIKNRRDLAFRLARLAALDLDAKDRVTVESLRAYSIDFSG